MTIKFIATLAMGNPVEGPCLVASDGFSARYDLDRVTGKFSRPAHKLFGHDYRDKILNLDTAKGGVATAWMLFEMKSRGVYPAAIVLNTVNPILAQGAAMADIPLMAGFDCDITASIASGSVVRLNPPEKSLTLIT